MQKRKDISPVQGNALKKPVNHGAGASNSIDELNSSNSSISTITNTSTQNLLKGIRAASKTDVNKGSTADLLNSIRQSCTTKSKNSTEDIVTTLMENINVSTRTEQLIEPINDAKLLAFGGISYGVFVNVLTIDVLMRDGRQFSGNMRKEAFMKFVIPTLGIKPEDVHTLKQGFGKTPYYMVGLKEVIRSSTLPKGKFDVETKYADRNGVESSSTVTCALRGLERKEKKAKTEKNVRTQRRRMMVSDGSVWTVTS
ncbi:MAG: hypothetical protein HQK53_18130 [Oligoflexia bacterium]|nr:hypothetical protein [Oligoflexia bacterium]